MSSLDFQLPVWDLSDGIFRAWWFDPLVASAAFAFFVNYYWYHERIRGRSSVDTFGEAIGWGPLFESLSAYWAGVYVFRCIVPPPAPVLPDGIPHDLGDACYLLAEVLSGIIAYDAIMFVLHWAMHEFIVLKHYHARHHNCPAGKLEARDTLRHSLVDGSLQVLANILVQRRTPWGTVKTRLARALHNIIVTWMLTESHTASPYPYIWRRWCVGVREHILHHGPCHNGTHGRYQQFFGYLDDSRAWWKQYQLMKTNKVE